MASGFVQRWKGKIDVDQIWISGQPVYGPAITQTLSTTSATHTINQSGVTTIANSSGADVWRIASPTIIGIEKTIQLTTVSSGTFICANSSAAAAAPTFNGSSNTVVKMLNAGIIELRATSTSNWAITGVFPSSLGLTISTTT